MLCIDRFWNTLPQKIQSSLFVLHNNLIVVWKVISRKERYKSLEFGFPTINLKPIQSTVSRSPALIDVKVFVVGTRATPIRVTCPSEAETLMCALFSWRFVRMCLGASVLPNPGSVWKGVSDFSPFTCVTRFHESSASGPILWSHYLILRVVEWCWLLKPIWVSA